MSRKLILLAVVLPFAAFLSACEDENLRSDKIAPSKSDVLRAQIVTNSQVAVATGPYVFEPGKWQSANESDHRYGLRGEPGRSPLVLVQVDEHLISAAINSWAASISIVDDDATTNARLDLQKRFLRDGARAFILLSQPLQNGDGNWGHSFRDLSETSRIVTYSGKQGLITSSEECENGIIDKHSSVFSCLLMFSDVILSDDPNFFVEFPITYYFRSENHLEWVVSERQVIRFKFDAGITPLTSLVSSGVDWKKISETYVDTHVSLIRASHGELVQNFFISAAADIMVGLMFRGLR